MLWNIAWWGQKIRDCPHAEGMNDEVSIENIFMGCETEEGGFKCTGSVDILSSLTEPEQVFLSVKMADHSGIKVFILLSPIVHSRSVNNDL